MTDWIVVSCSPLYSLIYHNLSISTVIAIFADKDSVLITGNAKAAAVILLYLIAPLTGIVIKKLHCVAINIVRLIDK